MATGKRHRGRQQSICGDTIEKLLRMGLEMKLGDDDHTFLLLKSKK